MVEGELRQNLRQIPRLKITAESVVWRLKLALLRKFESNRGHSFSIT